MKHNRGPIVWVVKEQVKRADTGSSVMDYTPAMKYGELRFITQFDLPTHPNSSVAAEWYKDVNRFLEECDDTQDFIVLTGSPLAIFVIGRACGMAKVFLTVLVWKREQNMYVPFNTKD